MCFHVCCQRSRSESSSRAAAGADRLRDDGSKGRLPNQYSLQHRAIFTPSWLSLGYSQFPCHGVLYSLEGLTASAGFRAWLSGSGARWIRGSGARWIRGSVDQYSASEQASLCSLLIWVFWSAALWLLQFTDVCLLIIHFLCITISLPLFLCSLLLIHF